jgi:hypothetical protein
MGVLAKSKSPLRTKRSLWVVTPIPHRAEWSGEITLEVNGASTAFLARIFLGGKGFGPERRGEKRGLVGTSARHRVT